MYTMSNFNSRYNQQNVVLAPITDDQSGILDNNLEPPFVRVRARNASSGYIDNFNASARLSNASYIMRSDNGLLVKRTKRVSINKFSAQLAAPNLNERNNTLIFSNGAGLITTATIPPGFYTRTEAITALINTLNGFSGSTGITFSAAPQFPGNDIYTVITGSAPFRFEGGTFVTVGFVFWGFLRADPRFTTTVPRYTTLTIGPITALYSRYYDICSSTLLQHTKAANTGNNAPANLLARIPAFAITQVDPTDSFFENHELGADYPSWNFDASHSVANVDMQLYDEFGQPFYLPNGLENASWFIFNLTNEL